MKYYADEVNIHARIYAMRSRLVSLEGYSSLLRDQEASYDKASGSRGMIEAKETVFGDQIKVIIHLAEATQRYAPLFVAFLCQYEASNVKLILAKAFGRQSLEQWYDIGPYATLDKGLLARELSLDDIQEILAGTYLAEVFEEKMVYERLETRVGYLYLPEPVCFFSILFPRGPGGFPRLYTPKGRCSHGDPAVETQSELPLER